MIKLLEISMNSSVHSMITLVKKYLDVPGNGFIKFIKAGVSEK